MSDRTSEPTAQRISGYSPSGGYDETAFDHSIASAYGFGEWRNGRVIEPGDEESDRYIDGMAELRAIRHRPSNR